MKIFSLAIFLMTFFLSCSNDRKVPAGILSKQKMEAMMWDMIRSGEFLSSYVFSRDTSIDKEIKSLEWFKEIYKIHHVSEAEFKKSYDYYRAHPVLMKELMDSLGKKHSVPEQIEQREPVVPDTTDKKAIIIQKPEKSVFKITDSLKKGTFRKRKD
jgi:Domain of unknown function (DUF4296)